MTSPTAADAHPASIPSALAAASAAVDPEELVVCWHLALAHAWRVMAVDPEAATVRVPCSTGIRLVGVDNPIGRMVLTVHRYLGPERETDADAMAWRLLLLFERLRAGEDAFSSWVAVDEGQLAVHDDLVRAAAVTPIVVDGLGRCGFDEAALFAQARKASEHLTPHYGAFLPEVLI